MVDYQVRQDRNHHLVERVEVLVSEARLRSCSFTASKGTPMTACARVLLSSEAVFGLRLGLNQRSGAIAAAASFCIVRLESGGRLWRVDQVSVLDLRYQFLVRVCGH